MASSIEKALQSFKTVFGPKKKKRLGEGLEGKQDGQSEGEYEVDSDPQVQVAEDAQPSTMSKAPSRLRRSSSDSAMLQKFAALQQQKELERIADDFSYMKSDDYLRQSRSQAVAFPKHGSIAEESPLQSSLYGIAVLPSVTASAASTPTGGNSPEASAISLKKPKLNAVQPAHFAPKQRSPLAPKSDETQTPQPPSPNRPALRQYSLQLDTTRLFEADEAILIPSNVPTPTLTTSLDDTHPTSTQSSVSTKGKLIHTKQESLQPSTFIPRSRRGSAADRISPARAVAETPTGALHEFYNANKMIVTGLWKRFMGFCFKKQLRSIEPKEYTASQRTLTESSNVETTRQKRSEHRTSSQGSHSQMFASISSPRHFEFESDQLYVPLNVAARIKNKRGNRKSRLKNEFDSANLNLVLSTELLQSSNSSSSLEMAVVV
ncbi:hypothetical protein HDU97_005839 [Phlyctochytrium planicorne]|nr:hypothetical protein HDU97_005839 [Phlyctochytrium planicorne]